MENNLILTKIEDLNRMMYALKRERETEKSIAQDLFDEAEFSESYCSEPLCFLAKSGGSLHIELIMQTYSLQQCEISVKVYLNGAVFGQKQIASAEGERQSLNCFFCSYAPPSEYTLTLEFYSTESGVSVKNCSVVLKGDIEYACQKSKVTICEEGVHKKAAVCDRDSIYIDYIMPDGKTVLMRWFKNRGDFALSSCPHAEQSQYDTIFAFCDEGRLSVRIIPYHSSFEEYLLEIDDNVSCVSAAKTLSPNGCIIFYIKNGSIYCALLQKDAFTQKIELCFKYLHKASPLALKVTAVQNITGGWGYILSEKPKKNTLHMYRGNFHSVAGDTVCAEIAAQIEDL